MLQASRESLTSPDPDIDTSFVDGLLQSPKDKDLSAVHISDGDSDSDVNIDPKANESEQLAKQHVPKRLKCILADNKIKDFNLREHLEGDLTRKTILREAPSGCLTKKRRKLLMAVLAEFLLNISPEPTVQQYQTLTEKIIQLFPKEDPLLYYVAPKQTGPHQTLSRGKLFNAVRNKVSKLIKDDAREPRRKRKTLGESSESDQNQIRDPSTEVSAALVLVKRACDISNEVTEKWRLSSEYRLENLYAGAKASSKRPKKSKKSENNVELPPAVSKYFEDFKILKNPKGYTLLLIDFDVLHENAKDLFAVWPSLQGKLQTLAGRETIPDKEGKLLARFFSPAGSDTEGNADEAENGNFHDLDDNNKDAVLLQLLPSLCPPTARVILGKSTVKPSVQECRSAFMTHITVGADLEPMLERQRQRMMKLKAPLQPYIILQGPTRDNIVASYVVFDSVVYKTESVLKSVDVCFKLYHALCAGYPPEANHIWHIFHLYVYEIKHDPLLDGVVNSKRKYLLVLAC